MIDEADEFVSGPQNKHKRPGEPSMQGIPKRRRCMSPLLRGRPQTPPVVNNHIGGKGPPSPITQAQLDLVKPIPIHKSKWIFVCREFGMYLCKKLIYIEMLLAPFPNRAIFENEVFKCAMGAYHSELT